ncbi:hypothetical protein M514_02923 [Trichuris suis]|uniref:Uncharacterized protein n=1 Tax=Trichuris suis TaxID=68888 RepID=A0A085NB23_9BILA|nr:hypothetical protein M513_02923 [Trichuris suis]KFD66669.1 hypothetical protein M514_02923 [Trichuris suis]
MKRRARFSAAPYQESNMKESKQTLTPLRQIKATRASSGTLHQLNFALGQIGVNCHKDMTDRKRLVEKSATITPLKKS